VEAYYNEPVLFAADMLKFECLDYQKAPLMALADGDRRIAITSGHGTGKSTVVAIAMIWFLLTRYPCRVVATAPTLAQVDSVLMGAVRSFINQLPPALQDLLEVQRDRVFLKAAPDEAWMAARTARAENPEALAGIHAAHVLLLADEASGIHDTIFEHAIGSMSGHSAHTMLTSNPTRRTGFFYKVFNDPLASVDWRKFRFSCRDSDLVSAEFIKQVEDTYGADSNQVRVRVDGLFPTEDVDIFLSGTLVQDATTRDIQVEPAAPAVLGVDVARMGADRTAICLRREQVVEEIRSWAKKDLMQTTGLIVAYIQALPPEMRPVEVNVDAIGMGAGVADRLNEVFREKGWTITVNSVNVAEAATADDRAHRLKDELWLRAKDWLEQRDCRIPDETDFIDDLLAPGYEFASNGKIKIESKDDMKRRGKKSTDLADSFCLTFAGFGAGLLRGNRRSWNEPIKRNLKGVI